MIKQQLVKLIHEYILYFLVTLTSDGVEQDDKIYKV